MKARPDLSGSLESMSAAGVATHEVMSTQRSAGIRGSVIPRVSLGNLTLIRVITAT